MLIICQHSLDLAKSLVFAKRLSERSESLDLVRCSGVMIHLHQYIDLMSNETSIIEDMLLF